MAGALLVAAGTTGEVGAQALGEEAGGTAEAQGQQEDASGTAGHGTESASQADPSTRRKRSRRGSARQRLSEGTGQKRSRRRSARKRRRQLQARQRRRGSAKSSPEFAHASPGFRRERAGHELPWVIDLDAESPANGSEAAATSASADIRGSLHGANGEGDASTQVTPAVTPTRLFALRVSPRPAPAASAMNADAGSPADADGPTASLTETSWPERPRRLLHSGLDDAGATLPSHQGGHQTVALRVGYVATSAHVELVEDAAESVSLDHEASLGLAYEFPLWSGHLNLELAGAVLRGREGLSLPAEVLIKVPFELQSTAEVFVGAGAMAEWVREGHLEHSYGAVATLGYSYWPSERIGMTFATDYARRVRHEVRFELGATAAAVLRF